MGFLRIQRLCLHFIGFSFKTDESRFLQLYSLFNWISVISIIIPETHFLIENVTDILLAAESLSTLLTSLLTFIKILTLYFKKKAFYRVVAHLDNMWCRSTPGDRLTLEEGRTIEKRVTLFYLSSSVLTGGLYLLFPIVKGLYEELYSNDEAEWIMPMRSKFMYDISTSPNYELTYLWFVHCTCLAVFGSVGVDCLFYGSLLNISSHFKIIQKKVRNMNFDQVMTKRKACSSERSATNEFFDLIDYHRKILNICEEFRNMYSPVLFAQFLVTSADLCVIAFQLTLPNQQLMIMATLVMFLSAICFQLFTYCHAGSQLTTESFAVSEAIYDSNWYKATPLTKKLIGFFLMRSQKSIVMSSGFYVANLETFKAILSAAGSYIAILQSLSEGNN